MIIINSHGSTPGLDLAGLPRRPPEGACPLDLTTRSFSEFRPLGLWIINYALPSFSGLFVFQLT
jgi:hypothetical protein